MPRNTTIDPLVQDPLITNELAENFMKAQNQFHEEEAKLIQGIKSYKKRLDTVQRTEHVYDKVISMYIFNTV